MIKEKLHESLHQIIIQSICIIGNGIEKVSRCVQAYLYLFLTSHVQARSSIGGNSASAVNTQEVFKSMLSSHLTRNFYISADIDRYQKVLEHLHAFM